MDLLSRLESLVEAVRQEILTTGTVTIRGRPFVPSTLQKKTPYDGLCAGAVEKLKELAPDLEVRDLSLDLPGLRKHVVAEVRTQEGVVIVDPTIEQYLPRAKHIYSSFQEYPLPILGKPYRPA